MNAVAGTPIEVAGRVVGPGLPCLVVAEAGVNHNGDARLAHQLVDAAADAGADAVKFQVFDAARLVVPSAPKAEYQRTSDPAEDQLEMLRRLELPAAEFRTLKEHCEARGLLFLCSPFDEGSADLLDNMDVAAFKVASGELTNLPLLGHLAAKGRPMIVSTGMATLQEVRTAVDVVRGAGNDRLVLLHCVSCYPAAPSWANLRAMTTMAAAFRLPVGFSDHSLGASVSLAAVALGACLLEKHLTLDRSLPGPDHQASLEPAEMTALVTGVREVEAALGDGRKEPVPCEAEMALVARKSLATARAIAAGETLAEADVVVRRPGTGLPPIVRPQVVGRRLRRAVPAGTPLTPDLLA